MVDDFQDWRPWLRRKVVVLLVIKLIALLLIKFLFFSGTNKPKVTAELLGARLTPQSKMGEARND